MHMPKALPKIDFTILHRNMIITLCATVCDVNNESKTNIVIRINACKKMIYFPFPLSIPLLLVSFLVFLQQSWSWYYLNWSFLGGWIPLHSSGQP